MLSSGRVGAWSARQMVKHVGQLAVNPVIYAELCYRADSPEEVDDLLVQFGLIYLETPREALFLAAKAYAVYRQRGGLKSAPLPDFFIGAQAALTGLRILTRDPQRYRTYFPSVELISH